ncbi:MAG: single-stranded DNA-binding protein [Chloroflexota bacterium]|nr:single-stranded DNA-binding protein [Chloroflexota bacterium]
MARDLNKVMLIGRLGADPELRYTPSGAAVANFSLACSRNWRTPEGDTREETEWVRIVGWNKLAETMGNYLTKGAKVYVEGRLQTRSWEGQDGQKRYTTEVIANEMIMLDSRRGQGAPGSSGDDEPAGIPGGGQDDIEDIPF